MFALIYQHQPDPMGWSWREISCDGQPAQPPSEAFQDGIRSPKDCYLPCRLHHRTKSEFLMLGYVELLSLQVESLSNTCLWLVFVEFDQDQACLFSRAVGWTPTFLQCSNFIFPISFRDSTEMLQPSLLEVSRNAKKPLEVSRFVLSDPPVLICFWHVYFKYQEQDRWIFKQFVWIFLQYVSYIFTLNDESTKKVAESTKPHLASLDQRPVGGPADATQRLQRWSPAMRFADVTWCDINDMILTCDLINYINGWINIDIEWYRMV